MKKTWPLDKIYLNIFLKVKMCFARKIKNKKFFQNCMSKNDAQVCQNYKVRSIYVYKVKTNYFILFSTL